MEKNHRIIVNVTIIIFFSILFLIRFSWFEQHFTNYDDIKVAQFTDFTTNLFDWKFRSMVQNGAIATKTYNILSIFVAPIYNWISYAINFSKFWTYAPGQFVITFALLPLAYDYSSIKFFGRFPSLLFGCISLIICWKVVKKYTGSDKVAFATTCILGFSWQSILYCMHMSNYESIILIGFIIAYLLYNCLKKDTNKVWFISVGLIGIMTWFHYQTVCYLSGVMLTYIYKNYKEKVSIKNNFIKVIIMCFIYTLIVFPLLLFANVNGVPTWNTGANGEYLYKPSFDLIYTFKFFFVNSCKVFKAMLSPVPLHTVEASFLSVIYMLLFLYGTVKGIMGYKTRKDLFSLSIFCWGTILTEYFFVFLGKFTLSPTRHSNLLIPIFILEIMIGLYYLFINVNMIRKMRYLPYVFIVCIMLLWCTYAGEVKKERTDLYNVDSVNELISKYNPDIVIDRFAPQLWYLLGSEYNKKDIIDYQTDFYELDSQSLNYKKILIMSSTNKIDEKVIKDIAEQLVTKGYLSKSLGHELLSASPIVKYEYETNVDFDFYNVTQGSANNFNYRVFTLN